MACIGQTRRFKLKFNKLQVRLFNFVIQSYHRYPSSGSSLLMLTFSHIHLHTHTHTHQHTFNKAYKYTYNPKYCSQLYKYIIITYIPNWDYLSRGDLYGMMQARRRREALHSKDIGEQHITGRKMTFSCVHRKCTRILYVSLFDICFYLFNKIILITMGLFIIILVDISNYGEVMCSTVCNRTLFGMRQMPIVTQDENRQFGFIHNFGSQTKLNAKCI